MGLKVGWGRVSGNHQGKANSDSQVDGDQIWCPLAGSLGKGLRKGIMAFASTSVWEKVATPALTLNFRQFSSSTNVPGNF